MEAFQKIIIAIAILVLIAILGFITLTIVQGKAKEEWPPIVPECPDYWLSVGKGDISGNDLNGNIGEGPYCVNTRDLGKCPAQPGGKHLIMNFNQPPFNGSDSTCMKYKWASKCGVSWDGITYGLLNNPCDDDTTDNTLT